jgi:hypothetical protein
MSVGNVQETGSAITSRGLQNYSLMKRGLALMAILYTCRLRILPPLCLSVFLFHLFFFFPYCFMNVYKNLNITSRVCKFVI